ncbi:hypothetical protein K435DRAFT_812885 [Dendrothele bispora CBS 962.96]|uniref:Uncharacterized protein n=1 Tax=Dendrothele bispora (strain CBS 962.96) TaxID=1314807 RepID=A0A4S8KMZ9_DENBC|nr:hypothetical protein K435DRAFT_812885 [Dendrothele bispora CBS 962.96]
MTPQTTVWGDNCRSNIQQRSSATTGTAGTNSKSSPSSSNTGAMVGDVGVMRWRNRYNDGLMERPEGGVVGGMFPDIAVNDDHPTSLMSQLDDDGMGNQLNASTLRLDLELLVLELRRCMRIIEVELVEKERLMSIIDLRLVGNDSNKEEQEEERSLVFLVLDLQLFAVWEDQHKDRADSLVPKEIEVVVRIVGGIQVLMVMEVNKMRMEDKKGMRVAGLKKRRGCIWLVGLGHNKVHRDGGRVPEPQQPETPEGPEEIPPTYDSLVLNGDERPRNGKGGECGWRE